VTLGARVNKVNTATRGPRNRQLSLATIASFPLEFNQRTVTSGPVYEFFFPIRLLPAPTRHLPLVTRHLFSSGWQYGHQKVVRASGPCLRRAMGVPQLRQGLPARPYTHNREAGSLRPVVRRKPT